MKTIKKTGFLIIGLGTAIITSLYGMDISNESLKSKEMEHKRLAKQFEEIKDAYSKEYQKWRNEDPVMADEKRMEKLKVMYENELYPVLQKLKNVEEEIKKTKEKE